MDILKIVEIIKADRKPRQIMSWQLFNALKYRNHGVGSSDQLAQKKIVTSNNNMQSCHRMAHG